MRTAKTRWILLLGALGVGSTLALGACGSHTVVHRFGHGYGPPRHHHGHIPWHGHHRPYHGPHRPPHHGYHGGHHRGRW